MNDTALPPRVSKMLHSRRFWLVLFDCLGIIGGYVLQTYFPEYQQPIVLIVGASQSLVMYLLAQFTEEEVLARISKTLGKTILALLIAGLLTLQFAPLLTAFAANPPMSDEGLYASYMCRGGLGPFALQWFTTQYGNDHPGLDWVKATPHILNDYCGYMIVNPDTLQASWIVRVYAPYLRARYQGAP